MQRRRKKDNRFRAGRLCVFAAGLSLLLAGYPAALVFAQNEPAGVPRAGEEEHNPMAAIEKLLQEGTSGSFVYQREGRPDPFFPFLTQQIQQAEAAAREELSGMRRFEPGQLALVAIVQTEKGPVAMVQDSAGVGYMLRRGTRIGRVGEVIDIMANKVIIQQEAYSLTQEKQYRTVEMVLKKDGDK